MSTAISAAAALAAVAGALWVAPRAAGQRVRSWGALGRRPPLPGPAGPRGRPATASTGPRIAASAVAGAAVVLLLGGPVGLVLGAGVAVAGPRLLARLEPAAVRRRRERTARDLPVAADLLAACLAAGSTPDGALAAVGPAVGGPVGDALLTVLVALRLGADPRSAWAPVVSDPDLGPLARAVGRALDSGSPLAHVLDRCADDLRQRRRSAAEAAARAVAVRAAAPLGLCFLPAFVLLGVVPTVVGLAQGLLG